MLFSTFLPPTAGAGIAIQHLADWIQANQLPVNFWSIVLGGIWALASQLR